MIKVLIVEDDDLQNQILADWFADLGYSVDRVFNCADADNFLAVTSYDLIVLDWDLPDGAGVEVLARNRKRGLATPVLMLTGKSTIDNKELGFESGADDYLTKPFQQRELAARVKALLRRPSAYVEDRIQAGDLVICESERTVRYGDRSIPLTPKEFEILLFFVKNPDTIFSSDVIIQRVWPTDSETTSENIRKYVQRLRSKLENYGSSVTIATHHSLGYSLKKS